MTGLLITLVVLVIIAGSLIGLYNSLVAARARFQNAFSQIEIQLTRRYDLIPNIVEVAKKYMNHESTTLRDVIAARNGAVASLREAASHPGEATAINALNSAEQQFQAKLGGLRIQVEAYPTLKANSVMMQLNEQLASTENRVAFARQAYNDAATSYNVRRNSFPANLFAGLFGHGQDAAMLAFANSKDLQQAPKVSF